MKRQGAQAESFCRKPDKTVWAALIFGEDEGVVGDLSRELQSAWSAGAGEPDIAQIDEDAARREPRALLEALEARSLFGEGAIVRLAAGGDKAADALGKALAAAEAAPERFAGKLIVTAGALAKRSKLRTAFEGAAHAAALHVFADTPDVLFDRARAALSADGVDVEDDALRAFIAELPGHRALANAEIEKLALYGRDLGRPLTVDDVAALSAAQTDAAIAEVVRATLDGRPALAHRGFDRLLLEGASAISFLRAFQRELDRMIQAHGLSGGDIGMKLRPPVFRSAWPAFEARLRKWSVRRLARALERVYEAELTSKTAGAASDGLVRILINDLARAAR